MPKGARTSLPGRAGSVARGKYGKTRGMIDHTGLDISDPVKSRRFYEQALAPLGYRVLMEIPLSVTDGAVVLGMGVAPKPDFWLHQGTPQKPPLHVAFRADSRAVVDAFYKAAMAAGGKDNGPPGLRPHYHENYYGAFVLDPDGHNIEACCHDPA
jgi:catechol 2,3-dioxygenase-like lactoylglutathione lyase family enzyme